MPRIVDHQARRDAILERCFDLFARRGYGAVTVREIAREVKLSTGAVYHYFPDKAAILRSLFHRVSRRDVAEAVGQLQGASRREKLATLVGFVARNEGRLRATLQVAMDHYRQHPDDRGVLSETLGVYRAALSEQLALEEPGSDGVLLSLLIGAIIHRTLDPSGVDIAAHLAALEAIAGSPGGE